MPLVGMTADALDALFQSAPARRLEIDPGANGAIEARSLEGGSSGFHSRQAPRWPREIVFRQFLREEEGEGYWEFQRLSNDVAISWTKARYARDTWIDIPGPSAAFKIRLLLSGEISHPDSQLDLRGPASVLSVYPMHTNNGYVVRGGIDTEFIVLHCRPSLLTKFQKMLGEELPAPFHELSRIKGRPVSRHLPAMPNLQSTIRDLFQLRFRYSSRIQPFYLECKMQEILCNAMQEMMNRRDGARMKTGLQATDLRRVREAQRILMQELASPPQINALARMIGVSQTKLKADFKAVTGESIYEFVKRCRMERAAHMLQQGSESVAEIGFAVGYEYAANFAVVFKRHFGVAPRQWLALHHQRV
jgi:AraC-like DNA-binding protein